jgi:hypothetical protein
MFSWASWTRNGNFGVFFEKKWIKLVPLSWRSTCSCPVHWSPLGWCLTCLPCQLIMVNKWNCLHIRKSHQPSIYSVRFVCRWYRWVLPMKSSKPFCIVVKVEFEAYHLRQSTRVDFKKQLAINVDYDFPIIFAILDCKVYEWKNCPIAW